MNCPAEVFDRRLVGNFKIVIDRRHHILRNRSGKNEAVDDRLMDVARKNDFFAGFDRGHDHRDDAAAGTINKKEGFIGSAGIGEQFLSAFKMLRGASRGYRVRSGRSRRGDKWRGREIGRGIFNIAHMMSGDIKGGDVLRGIFP
jgi:hypothetical protein